MGLTQEQKEAKEKNRAIIIQQIATNQLGFNELGRQAHISPPRLSKHLKEMMAEGIIEKGMKEGRVAFFLTSEGKGQERQLRDYVMKAFEQINTLSAENPAAMAFLDFTKLSKDDPQLFGELMQWFADYVTFQRSGELQAWISDKRGPRVLQAEVSRRIYSLITEKEFNILPPSQQLMFVLKNTLSVTRQVVSEKKSK